MKIKRTSYPVYSLQEFADEHGLTLNIHKYHEQRTTASFEKVEIKESSVLVSAYGDSITEDGAIQDYCCQISGKLLVFNSFGKNRKEFYCPVVTWNIKRRI